MEIFAVDKSGKYLGSFVGSETVEPPLPDHAIQVPYPPEDGRQIWDGKKWLPLSDKTVAE